MSLFHIFKPKAFIELKQQHLLPQHFPRIHRCGELFCRLELMNPDDCPGEARDLASNQPQSTHSLNREKK